METEEKPRPRRKKRRHSKAYYRRKKILRIKLIAGGILLLLVIIGLVFLIVHLVGKAAGKKDEEAEIPVEEPSEETISVSEDEPEEEIEEEPEEEEGLPPNTDMGYFSGYAPSKTAETKWISNPEVISEYGIIINLNTGAIIGEKNSDTIIYPASMTKVLTILVAAEHLKSLDSLNDMVSISQETTDFTYKNECSAVGFSVGETVPVKDLFFGTILPSGADAALTLAEYIAGDQDSFVAMMNAKVEELGRSSTAHFTNPIGLFDEENHCTVTDMAMILKAAEENDICRDVLKARRSTTSPTAEHPEGIEISNWFLRRIEDKDTHGEVMGAKTGFVVQSGNCGASYLESGDGTPYICVTGKAHSAWRCIYDHVAIYDDFVPKTDSGAGTGSGTDSDSGAGTGAAGNTDSATETE